MNMAASMLKRWYHNSSPFDSAPVVRADAGPYSLTLCSIRTERLRVPVKPAVFYLIPVMPFLCCGSLLLRRH